MAFLPLRITKAEITMTNSTTTSGRNKAGGTIVPIAVPMNEIRIEMVNMRMSLWKGAL
ncbi:hypothetical protein D3C73_1623170 [compost metagenome]